jgi:hypothetical protein
MYINALSTRELLLRLSDFFESGAVTAPARAPARALARALARDKLAP